MLTVESTGVEIFVVWPAIAYKLCNVAAGKNNWVFPALNYSSVSQFGQNCCALYRKE